MAFKDIDILIIDEEFTKSLTESGFTVSEHRTSEMMVNGRVCYERGGVYVYDLAYNDDLRKSNRYMIMYKGAYAPFSKGYGLEKSIKEIIKFREKL